MNWKQLIAENLTAWLGVVGVVVLAALKIIDPDIALGVLMGAAGLATTGGIKAALKPKADQ